MAKCSGVKSAPNNCTVFLKCVEENISAKIKRMSLACSMYYIEHDSRVLHGIEQQTAKPSSVLYHVGPENHVL